MSTVLNEQEGGNHYKELPIQPVEFITRNNIPFIEGSVIKYVVRHKRKNGKQDILKAIHFLQMLLELEYSNCKHNYTPLDAMTEKCDICSNVKLRD